MIINEYDLVRVPYFRKAHLLKLLYRKWGHDIVDHAPVHIYRHDISGLYVLIYIITYYLFY